MEEVKRTCDNCVWLTDQTERLGWCDTPKPLAQLSVQKMFMPRNTDATLCLCWLEYVRVTLDD